MTEDLVRVLDNLYHNRDILDAYSVAARDRAVTEYAWEVKARRMANLYKRVLSAVNGSLTGDRRQ